LRGGMGNQMFEYATGLALAKKYNAELVLDTTYLADRFPRKDFTPRHYELDAFALPPRFAGLSRAAHTVPIPGVWLGLDLALMKARDLFGARKLIAEKHGRRFDPSVLDAGGNACLWGLWQSEKYFESARDEVRAAFTFARALPPSAGALGDQIKKTNSISLSVRRGDYVNASNTKLFGGTNTQYYRDAIEHMSSRVPDPHFFVFSDDIAWCREHITIPFETTYIPAELDGPSALQLLSLCKHQIIANSSFSWWGAWLNGNPGKIVVAPKKWYADPAADDIVPEQWIRA